MRGGEMKATITLTRCSSTPSADTLVKPAARPRAPRLRAASPPQCSNSTAGRVDAHRVGWTARRPRPPARAGRRSRPAAVPAATAPSLSCGIRSTRPATGARTHRALPPALRRRRQRGARGRRSWRAAADRELRRTQLGAARSAALAAALDVGGGDEPAGAQRVAALQVRCAPARAALAGGAGARSAALCGSPRPRDARRRLGRLRASSATARTGSITALARAATASPLELDARSSR